MIDAHPSRTALRVALRRASHQLYDSKPLVLSDPLAVPILGAAGALELARTPVRADRPHSSGLRAFIVARSRFAEDTLAHAAASSVTQYVLLGAGLDTFAYRNPFPGVRVFEVDHPATQAWKRDLLATSRIVPPSTLDFVPVDFEQQELARELASAGFDKTCRTLFAWLGVVPYLTYPGFRATLDLIESQPHGSGVVFDYAQPRRALPPLEQLAHDSLAARVALAGEPFRLFFTPDEIRRELVHFNVIEDLGSHEINAIYFRHRDDDLQLRGTAGRLVRATL